MVRPTAHCNMLCILHCKLLFVKAAVSRDLFSFFLKIRPGPHMNRQKRFRELFRSKVRKIRHPACVSCEEPKCFDKLVMYSALTRGCGRGNRKPEDVEEKDLAVVVNVYRR